MSVKVAKISEKIATNRIVDEVIVVNESKPEYGSIMLEEVAFVNSDGFMNKQRRVAFLRGEVETLKEYVSSANLKVGSVVPGKIYVVEKTTPFYEGQEPKINPKTNEIITSEGALIYRNSFLGRENDVDVLLKADKAVDAYVNQEDAAIKAMGE